MAGEGHKRRRVWKEADDADALKAEAAGNCSTCALEHGTRAELSARESAGEAVQRLELCGFGWAGHVVLQRGTAAGVRVYGNCVRFQRKAVSKPHFTDPNPVISALYGCCDI